MASGPSAPAASFPRLDSGRAGQVAPDTSGAPLRAGGEAARPTDRGILDYPHYTRPQTFRGWDVPEVLMSGNHEEIRRWRRQKAIEKTLRNRPDLLEGMAAGQGRDG